jgi:hypothetical protein
MGILGETVQKCSRRERGDAEAQRKIRERERRQFFHHFQKAKVPISSQRLCVLCGSAKKVIGCSFLK